MGLFGLDANSSSSSLTQAQVSTQYGNAYGANTGKGAASTNATGSTAIGGGVKLGKGASFVVNSSNADLENSILTGLDNITGLLQNEPSSSSTLSPTTNAGNAGASGASSSSSQGDLTSLTSSITSLIGELQNNQSTSTANSTSLLDGLNAMGSGDVSGVAHPTAGSVVFSPNSGGNTSEQASSFPWGTLLVAAATVAVTILVTKLINKTT